MRWRTTAMFVCVGLAANVLVGALTAARLVTTFPSGAVSVFLWWPPAVDERLLPMLHRIAQLRGHTALFFGYLALHALISILLAIGLWKMNKWAAWITSALLVLKVTFDVLMVLRIKDGTSFGWFVTLGFIPSLAWSTLYLLLLWGDWIVRGLRVVVSFANTLRRERV